MKRNNITALLLTLCLFTLGVKAQNEVSVIMTQAPWVKQMPTELMSYLNEPFQYVNVTMINNTPNDMDVYVDFDLSSSVSIEGQDDLHIFTDNDMIGGYINIPSLITLHPGTNRISPQDLSLNLKYRTNIQMDYSQLNLSTLTLPEGYYSFCITVAREGVDVSLPCCLKYNLCYSGSAPMITTPILVDQEGEYPVLEAMRKVNFIWTGVISNCLQPNQFNYTIKFVEVYPQQNPQQAIDNNPVLASIECGKRTFFTYDMITDRRLVMDTGHVYAVQVLATPVNSSITANLSNNGWSDFMVFEWRGTTAAEQLKAIKKR